MLSSKSQNKFDGYLSGLLTQWGQRPTYYFERYQKLKWAFWFSIKMIFYSNLKTSQHMSYWIVSNQKPSTIKALILWMENFRLCASCHSLLFILFPFRSIFWLWSILTNCVHYECTQLQWEFEKFLWDNLVSIKVAS